MNIFTWKLFEETCHAWIQLNIKTSTDDLLSTYNTRSSHWVLTITIIVTILTFHMLHLKKKGGYFNFNFFHSRYFFNSLMSNISKTVRDRRSCRLRLCISNYSVSKSKISQFMIKKNTKALLIFCIWHV